MTPNEQVDISQGGAAVAAPFIDFSPHVYRALETRMFEESQKQQRENLSMQRMDRWLNPPTDYFSGDTASIANDYAKLLEKGASYRRKGIDYTDPKNTEAYMEMRNIIMANNARATQSLQDKEFFEMFTKSFDPAQHDAEQFDLWMEKYTSAPLGERHKTGYTPIQAKFDPYVIFDVFDQAKLKPQNQEEAAQLFDMFSNTPTGREWVNGGIMKENGPWKDLQGAKDFYMKTAVGSFTQPAPKSATKPKSAPKPNVVLAVETNPDPTYEQDGKPNVFFPKTKSGGQLPRADVEYQGQLIPFDIHSAVRMADGTVKYRGTGHFPKQEASEENNFESKKARTEEIWVTESENNQGVYDFEVTEQETTASPSDVEPKTDWSKYKRK